MIMLKLFLFLFLKGVLADKNDTERSGVQLWRAQGDFDEEVLDEFYDRARFTEEIWKRDNRTIDFLIFDVETEDIAAFLDSYNVSHKVLIDDVRQRVDEALLETFPSRRNAMSGDSLTWTGYPSLNEIYGYLGKLASTYPSHCQLITIGKTSHAKPIKVLKISNGNKNNKAVLVESGMHGRERTGVISTLYFIDSIVRNFDKQPNYIKIRDWHVLPVMNPDGYDYSLTTDRLWRKNRRRFSGCYGVDLNRNFGYNWGKDETTGVACTENFCGPETFSEEETRAFKRLIDGTRFYGYISVHSAGGKVLFPFGADHEDHNKHLERTKQMALAMGKVANQHFVNGDIRRMGKSSYGMAIDWMYFTNEIINSYMIETRGQNGVDLISPSEILPAAKEVRAGIMKFAELLK